MRIYKNKNILAITCCFIISGLLLNVHAITIFPRSEAKKQKKCFDKTHKILVQCENIVLQHADASSMSTKDQDYLAKTCRPTCDKCGPVDVIGIEKCAKLICGIKIPEETKNVIISNPWGAKTLRSINNEEKQSFAWTPSSQISMSNALTLDVDVIHELAHNVHDFARSNLLNNGDKQTWFEVYRSYFKLPNSQLNNPAFKGSGFIAGHTLYNQEGILAGVFASYAVMDSDKIFNNNLNFKQKGKYLSVGGNVLKKIEQFNLSLFFIVGLSNSKIYNNSAHKDALNLKARSTAFCNKLSMNYEYNLGKLQIAPEYSLFCDYIIQKQNGFNVNRKKDNVFLLSHEFGVKFSSSSANRSSNINLFIGYDCGLNSEKIHDQKLSKKKNFVIKVNQSLNDFISLGYIGHFGRNYRANSFAIDFNKTF